MTHYYEFLAFCYSVDTVTMQRKRFYDLSKDLKIYVTKNLFPCCVIFTLFLIFKHGQSICYFDIFKISLSESRY